MDGFMGIIMQIASFVKSVWDARQAKRTALYPEGLKVFQAFREVQRALTGHGVDIDRRVVVEFCSRYCDESRFVFGPEIQQEMAAFCRGLDELLELQRRPSESDVAQARLHECETRALRIRKLMDTALSQKG
jgi:hypothetical protein